jgi:hypothetical protein
MNPRIPPEALDLSDEIDNRTGALMGVFAELVELSGPGHRVALYHFALREAEAIEKAHRRLLAILRGEVADDATT